MHYGLFSILKKQIRNQKYSTMGGEGSMMHAIKSLKENRILLKKRKLKSKDDVFGKKNSTLLSFKKSTPKDIIRIREEMQLQNQRNLRIRIIAFIISILFILAFYLLIS